MSSLRHPHFKSPSWSKHLRHWTDCVLSGPIYIVSLATLGMRLIAAACQCWCLTFCEWRGSGGGRGGRGRGRGSDGRVAPAGGGKLGGFPGKELLDPLPRQHPDRVLVQLAQFNVCRQKAFAISTTIHLHNNTKCTPMENMINSLGASWLKFTSAHNQQHSQKRSEPHLLFLQSLLSSSWTELPSQETPSHLKVRI